MILKKWTVLAHTVIVLVVEMHSSMNPMKEVIA